MELTEKKEFDLLLLFVRNKNIALYRETIYERIWGGEYMGDSRTVDLHVQRLKKKLHWENFIIAVYKVGYRLNEVHTEIIFFHHSTPYGSLHAVWKLYAVFLF